MRSGVCLRLTAIHNIGHGEQNLFEQCYQPIGDKLPTRQTFFDDVRALTRYLS